MKCANRVRFEIAMRVDHIYSHEHFKQEAHPQSA